MSYVRL